MVSQALNFFPFVLSLVPSPGFQDSRIIWACLNSMSTTILSYPHERIQQAALLADASGVSTYLWLDIAPLIRSLPNLKRELEIPSR